MQGCLPHNQNLLLWKKNPLIPVLCVDNGNHWSMSSTTIVLPLISEDTIRDTMPSSCPWHTTSPTTYLPPGFQLIADLPNYHYKPPHCIMAGDLRPGIFWSEVLVSEEEATCSEFSITHSHTYHTHSHNHTLTPSHSLHAGSQCSTSLCSYSRVHSIQ